MTYGVLNCNMPLEINSAPFWRFLSNSVNNVAMSSFVTMVNFSARPETISFKTPLVPNCA